MNNNTQNQNVSSVPNGVQYYGPQGPYVQNQQINYEQELYSLLSIRKLAKAYLWLYFLAVICWFIAIVVFVAAVAVAYTNLYYDVPAFWAADAAFIAFIVIGCLFAFADFIISIILAVKASNLKAKYHEFDTPFILFVIGIFINLLSMIGSFIVLSNVKKILPNLTNNQLK